MPEKGTKLCLFHNNQKESVIVYYEKASDFIKINIFLPFLVIKHVAVAQ